MSANTNEFDVVIVGAGFSGMYLVHRCRNLGLSCVVLEQGDDIGGTWYWNRYPGARCDVPTVEYSYSFDPELEQTWDWSELMCTQPEILKYANHVADRFDLRADMRFGRRVSAATFDEARGRWQVTAEAEATEAGTAKAGPAEHYDAQHLIMATGCLSVPNWPEIPGRDDFTGTVYHTGLWPHEPVDFTGLRVGIIGTGSSAVQSIPEIARDAEHLHVFQRTPVYTMPAENEPLDDAFRDDIKARYAEIRDTQRTSLAGMALYGVMGRLQEQWEVNILDCSEEDLLQRLEDDGLPSLRRYPDVLTDLTANEVACQMYREYVASQVHDPDKAQALMPRGYPLGCKRQVIDIDYYDAFNRDNVTIVDLRETPIERITADGLATTASSYAFDVLVYATGFDAMTGAVSAVDITGRGGQRLRDKWEHGPLTYLGLQSAGFPNLFTVTGPGSPSVLSNMLVSIEQHCEWITDCIAHVREHNLRTIEANTDAEDQWVAHVNEVAEGTMLTAESCNSWYLGANIPGKPRIFMPYVGGVGRYRRKMRRGRGGGLRRLYACLNRR